MKKLMWLLWCFLIYSCAEVDTITNSEDSKSLLKIEDALVSPKGVTVVPNLYKVLKYREHNLEDIKLIDVVFEENSFSVAAFLTYEDLKNQTVNQLSISRHLASKNSSLEPPPSTVTWCQDCENCQLISDHDPSGIIYSKCGSDCCSMVVVQL